LYSAVRIKICEYVQGWPCTLLPFSIHTADHVHNTSQILNTQVQPKKLQFTKNNLKRK